MIGKQLKGKGEMNEKKERWTLQHSAYIDGEKIIKKNNFSIFFSNLCQL